METNTVVQTAPCIMDAKISIDDLYASMELKVDIAPQTSSSGTEQGSYEVYLTHKPLNVV